MNIFIYGFNFIIYGGFNDKMPSMTGTDKVVGAIFGAILVFYLIANTFNDASDELEGVNESHKGGKLIKLLGLFLAFGVVFAMYKSFIGKK